MTASTNPLIKDDPSDTIKQIDARLAYIAQWAEGDEDLLALLQECQMLREAMRSLEATG